MSETTKQTARRSGAISRKKRLSKRATGTKLWVSDEEIFNEFVGRKHTTPAELLRDIVHQWATTIRVSGQAKDTMDAAGPIRKLHQQIIATELAPFGATLNEIRDLLRHTQTAITPAPVTTELVPTNGQDSALLTLLQRLAEELTNTREELRVLKLFAMAQFMLAGQSFAATWATLDFIQRYIAEPILKADPAHSKDYFQAAIVHRDDARKEGLQMVGEMALEFDYPTEYVPVLIVPPEDTP